MQASKGVSQLTQRKQICTNNTIFYVEIGIEFVLSLDEEEEINVSLNFCYNEKA